MTPSKNQTCLFLHWSWIMKNQQSTIELVTRPAEDDRLLFSLFSFFLLSLLRKYSSSTSPASSPIISFCLRLSSSFFRMYLDRTLGPISFTLSLRSPLLTSTPVRYIGQFYPFDFSQLTVLTEDLAPESKHFLTAIGQLKETGASRDLEFGFFSWILGISFPFFYEFFMR